MTIRKIRPGYDISDEFWMKIEPLLPLPKPKVTAITEAKKRFREDLEKMIAK